MNSGFFPVVLSPGKIRPQVISEEYKPTFFFGGSQVPNALSLKKGRGLMKADGDIPMKKVSKVYHSDGKLVKMFGREPFKKSGIY